MLVVGARRAKVATPPGIEIRDALALKRIITRLFALLNARQFARRFRYVFLTSACVTFDLGADLRPYASVFSSCKSQAIRNEQLLLCLLICVCI